MSEFTYQKKLVIFRGVPVKKKTTLYDYNPLSASFGLGPHGTHGTLTTSVFRCNMRMYKVSPYYRWVQHSWGSGQGTIDEGGENKRVPNFVRKTSSDHLVNYKLVVYKASFRLSRCNRLYNTTSTATVTKPDSDVNRENDKSILTEEWFHFDRDR